MKKIAPVILFALLVALCGQTLSGSYLLTTLIFIGIYVIIIIGLDLIIGYCGQFAFGHQGFFAIGAYASGVLTLSYEFPTLAAIAIGAALSCVTAYFLGVITLGLRGFYFAIATLSFGVVIYSLAGGLEKYTGGHIGLIGIPHFSVAGLTLDTHLEYYYLVWAIVMVVFFASWNIVRSRIGRAIRAISSDEMSAAASGIDVTKYRLQMFVLGAVYASIAGSLYTHYVRYLSPDTFALSALVQFLLMLLLGGKGTIWGAFLGVPIVQSIPEFSDIFREYMLIFYGALLVVVLFFLPDGLAGGIKAVATFIGRIRLRLGYHRKGA